MREREREEGGVPASTRATFLAHAASCLLGLLPGIGSPFYSWVSARLDGGMGNGEGPGSEKSRGTCGNESFAERWRFEGGVPGKRAMLEN